MGCLYELKDKIVLVTGGSMGIGESIAELCFFENAKMIYILDINETKGTMLKQRLNKKFDRECVQYIFCDVTKDCNIDNAFKIVIENSGRIDVLINNAGIIDDLTPRKAVHINVGGTIVSSMKAYELMRKDKGNDGGTIINISSIAALRLDMTYIPVYSAAKSAILNFTMLLGDEVNFVRSGVRMLTVAFGVTNTGILDKPFAFDKESQEHYETLTFYHQKVESAGRCLIDAFKRGKSGSVWYSSDDKIAIDVTDFIVKGQLYVKSKI